ncbi:MAG: hypothetical protein IRY87_02355 [Acetobacteraceae bacterium]|nr:hypothetical protein [Acetobacteraceae bacterium]
MTLDLQLQRVYDRVELVSGIGKPNSGTMCIMSFVAYLSGEDRTDCPSTASQVIRSFAIPINDQMPHSVRQRLKPFAPRIIGTNDGLDRVRAEILRRALTEEILPRVSERYRTPVGSRQMGVFGRLWIRLRRSEFERRIGRMLEQAASGNMRPGFEVQMASDAGRMIGLCARDARDAREEEWYWNEAIGLLDRLCDVGAETRRPEVRMDRLERLEQILGIRPSTHAPTPSTPVLWAAKPAAPAGTAEKG